LLRLEILPSGYICPPAARAVRDLARKRMQLVRSRTAQILSVENMLSRQTGAGMRSRAVQRLTAQAVEGFGFNPEVEQSMCANVAVIKTLNREIDKLEHHCNEISVAQAIGDVPAHAQNNDLGVELALHLDRVTILAFGHRASPSGYAV
jgi:hypothetical protein